MVPWLCEDCSIVKSAGHDDTFGQPAESNDEILQQMHDKMAEVLKVIESGETMIVHFASAKSLAEELVQTHAKQPKQKFTVTGAHKYRCPYCTNLYEDTDH